MSAADIQKDIHDAKLINVVVVRERRAVQKPGVCTTNAVKVMGQEIMEKLLKERKLRLLEDFVSGNPFIANVAESVAICKNTIHKQLINLRKLVSYSTKGTERPKVSITGKCDSNGRFNGEQDDVSITALLNVYWFNMWMRYREPSGSIIGDGIPVQGSGSIKKRVKR